MEKLEARGALVEFNDPYVPMIHKSREHPQYAGKRSVEITRDYDLILISTGHDVYRSFDFAGLGIPVVDTRNVVAAQFPLLYKA